MNSIIKLPKPAAAQHPPLKATRLLDQMRERLRYMHYSLRTEQTYLFWVRWFIRFSGLRHSDVSTTMIYTHVLKVAAGGTASPLDTLAAVA